MTETWQLPAYLGALVAALTVGLLVESAAPFRPVAAAPLARWIHNLLLSALSLAVAVFATPWLYTMALSTGLWPGNPRGLLARLDAPAWLTWPFTFLVLDGLSYALHRLSHHVPWLWRLHAVHHSDTEVDATTSFRHHPLESLLIAAVHVPVLLALGAPVPAVFAYSLVSVIVSVFSHANIGLGRLDGALRWLVVTPDFHRVHHSAAPARTNRNYATVFPLFDQLGRTATRVSPNEQQRMDLGLEYFRAPGDQRLDRLLCQPFLQPAAGVDGSAPATSRPAARALRR